MDTQIHKLTEVQSHSLVLVFVTMQGGLSPAAQTCVHTGALECWGQKDGALWARWDFSASQSFWLSEVLSCRAHSSAQSSKDASRASRQHLPTPSNAVSGPTTSARTHFTEVFIPKPAVSFEAHPARAASLPARATAGGISSLHFHFCSLFYPSDEDSDSDSDWRTKHQPSVKGRWSSTFLFGECTANWNIPSFQPLSTSLFMESPKHRQGSDVEGETIPSAIKHSFTSTDPIVVLSKRSSVLCCPSPLGTSMSWVNGNSIFNI